MSSRVQDLTLTEIGTRLARYKPVAVTLAVVLGALVALPERGSDVVTEIAAVPAAVSALPLADVGGAPSPDAPVTIPATSSTTTTRPLAPRPVATTTPVRTAARPTTTTTTTTRRPTTTAPPTTLHQQPTVGQRGWASTGTDPLAGGVPENTLPVATRLGDTAAVSFLELVGPWATLTLTVDESGAAGVGAPAVQACAITTPGWQPGPDQDLADAPSWSDSCVDGVPDGSTWRFAVGQIDHPHGVVLLPGTDAPFEARITFREP